MGRAAGHVRRRSLGRLARRAGLAIGVLFVALQLVPYGWSRENPPVTAEAPWPSQEVRSLAVAGCYGCHSNETDWPFYAYVAPISWLVIRDVEAGRQELNFSEWDRDQDAGDAARVVARRSMPPRRYTIAHADARLSSAERDHLVAALTAMDDDADGGGQGRGRGRGRGGDG